METGGSKTNERAERRPDSYRIVALFQGSGMGWTVLMYAFPTPKHVPKMQRCFSENNWRIERGMKKSETSKKQSKKPQTIW